MAESRASISNQDRVPVRVFLSHASEDLEAARWLRRRLLELGIVSWLDDQDIRGGDRWLTEIEGALRSCQAVVAMLTPTSVDSRRDRQWIEKEETESLRLLRPVIPCVFGDQDLIAGGRLPEHLKPLDVIRFDQDRERGLAELAEALSRHLPRTGDNARAFKAETPPIARPFIGRQDDLTTLKAWIDEAEGAALTGQPTIAIVGIGGMGKTMVAEELVRRLAAFHPGGVVFERRGAPDEVEGQSRKPAKAVLQEWAHDALGAPPSRIYDAPDVRSLLSVFGRILLLVDDAWPDDEPEIRLLLDAMPVDATRVVTTRSGELVRSLGARGYFLQSMSPEDSWDLIRARLKELPGPVTADAVRQAVQRYREPLDRLVRAVDGHPLALELGLGTCDRLGEIPTAVARLTSSLGQGVDAFAQLALEVTDRNHSLARCLDVGRNDLAALDGRHGTQLLRRFRALGLFPDGSRVSRSLLAAVWGDDEEAAPVERELKILLRRGLLRVEQASDEEETFIYFNHPVLRAYATGLLHRLPKERTTARRRYQRWVTTYAARGFGALPETWTALRPIEPHVQRVARQLIRAVCGDLVTLGRAAAARPVLGALDPLTADAETLELARDFATALREYAIRRPEWGEGAIHALELGLVCARLMADEDADAVYLQHLGGAWSRRDPAGASSYFEQALAHAPDDARRGAVLTYYGELERTRDHPARAQHLLDQALAIHVVREDRGMHAKTLASLGELAWGCTRLDEANERYLEARDLYRAMPYPWGEANVLNKLGSVAFNRGRQCEAIRFFEQALVLHRKLVNRSMEAEDLNDMGAARRYLGELEEAKRLFEQALVIHREQGNRRLEGITRSNLAGAWVGLGLYENAIEEADRAVELGQAVDAEKIVVWARTWKALALGSRGDLDAALSLLDDTLGLAKRLRDPRTLAGVHASLGLVHRDRGEVAPACDCFQKALDLMREHGIEQAFAGHKREDLQDAVAGLRDRPAG